jgi:hypothetical protein
VPASGVPAGLWQARRVPVTPDVRAAEAVDEAWLTAVLRAAGVGGGAMVTAFDATSIGTGQVGENVRFELTWSESDPWAPSSVVAKFPSTSEVSRAIAHHVDSYVKEVGFYRGVQHLVSVPTPLVHHVGWAPENQDFVIVMEDVRPAEQGDQLAGCDLDRARLAVDAAVGLHAPTWNRLAELESQPWLRRGGPEEVRQRAEMIAALAPGFLDRYAQRLDPEVLEIASALVAGFEAWVGAVGAWGDRFGWCLTHGDYRLDNMLFGTSTNVRPLTVVDWQTISIGFGPADVAYFCGAGLLPEQRSQHERSLLASYASGLRSSGVDVSDESAWAGYVLGSATGLIMAVLASQVVERTERGDEMFAVMAERHAEQIRDVGLSEIVGLS